MHALSLAAVLGSAWLVVSCATASGPELVAAVSKKMTNYSTLVGETRKQIDAVLGSLDAVQSSAASDPVPAFSAFTRNFDVLQSGFEKLRDGSAGIQDGMKKYLGSWGHEIGQMQDANLKAQSEKRRGQIETLFGAVAKKLEDQNVNGDRYVKQLGDVQKLLNHDLNPVGIAKAKVVLAQTRNFGLATMAALGETATQVDGFAKELAPAAR